MNYRDRDPRDYRSGRTDFENNRPDQYGQEHSGHRQYNPQHQADVGVGQSSSGQRQYGWGQSGPGQFGESGQYGRGRYDQRRGRDTGDWRASDQDWRGREGREDYLGRENQDWQSRPAMFSQEPSGHEPYAHSAFGQSNQPRYFGSGTQGYGGGPTFTGGTYGHADWRSDAPYFDEVGFNRGNYEDPLGRESEGPSQYRQARGGGYGFSSGWRGRTGRRYPQGPKGYTRSDERVREDISERLMQCYDIDSSEVTVQVQSGKVTLEGTVPSRHMKHAIEDIADSAPGVQDVDNRIRVTSSAARWGGNQDAGTLGQNANNPVAGSGSSSTSSSTTSGGRAGSTTRRDS